MHILIKIYSLRSMYVCFASGLLKEGLTLLHWSTLVVLVACCFNSAIIHPFRLYGHKFVNIKTNISIFKIYFEWKLLSRFSKGNDLHQNKYYTHPTRWKYWSGDSKETIFADNGCTFNLPRYGCLLLSFGDEEKVD